MVCCWTSSLPSVVSYDMYWTFKGVKCRLFCTWHVFLYFYSVKCLLPVLRYSGTASRSAALHVHVVYLHCASWVICSLAKTLSGQCNLNSTVEQKIKQVYTVDDRDEARRQGIPLGEYRQRILLEASQRNMNTITAAKCARWRLKWTLFIMDGDVLASNDFQKM